MSKYEKFYYDIYADSAYAHTTIAENHAFYSELIHFLKKYHVAANHGKCLEVGSGRGTFQDLVEDYTGLDLSPTVASYYHKPFVAASATAIPLNDNTYDFIWSYAALEHVPEPDKALEEMVRITKNGGHLYLAPAWHCRKWAANGYQVRPYSDFNLIGKLYKFLIPLLDSLAIRGSIMLIRRLFVSFQYLLSHKDFPLIYGKLSANYDAFWQSDSDACNSLDPFFTALWFESRGHVCVSHPDFIKKFFSTHDSLDIQILKN